MVYQKGNDMGEIFICENHDESLKIWRDRCIKNAIVIHVDAHIDFMAPDECYYVSIANYLNYAYNEGIINSLIWVVPDKSFSDCDIMNEIVREISAYFQLSKKSDHEFIFKLLQQNDFHLYITTISYINKIVSEMNVQNLLLDIDCDYFMNPNIKYTYSYFFPLKCWIETNAFCEKIYDIYNRCKVVTIAKSIIGGYTPLLFNYLSLQIENIFKKRINIYDSIEKAIEIMSIEPQEAIKIYLRKHQYLNDENKDYRLVGIIYCYMLQKKYKEAEKWYKILFKTNKRYERYFLPIHGMIKEDIDSGVEGLIENWQKVSPSSQSAVCYRIRRLLKTGSEDVSDIEKMFSKITDEETYYEKSYLYMMLTMKTGNYERAIQAGLCTINYLLKNDTPDWVDQISSFEKRKNHGIIIAKIYNDISVLHLKMGQMQEARRYARISKLMGFPTNLIK